MTGATPIPPSVIGDHASALQQLAAQLVGNRHDADDVVQETWLRALQSPPRDSSKPRPWLESVLRNVVRRRHRDKIRRSTRERAVAHEEQTSSTADLVVRRQTLQAMTTAILQLDSRLQTVVFARYFDGLPPRDIATRTGRPVEQVYRDLERARRLLRSHLRRSLGGDSRWRRGLAALFGLPVHPWLPNLARGLLATGVFVVAHKLILAAVATAFAAVVVLFVTDGTPPELSAPQIADESKSEAMAPTAVPPSSEGAARSAVPTDAREESSVLAPYEFAMEIHATDQDDLPAPDAEVWIAPGDHPLNSARTGPDGVLRLKWRGRTASMTMTWASPKDTTEGLGLRRVSVHAGSPVVVPLRVQNQPRSFHGQVLLTFYEVRAGTTHSINRPGQRPSIRVDEEGYAWFVSGDSSATNEFYLQGAASVDLSLQSIVDGEGNMLRTPMTASVGRVRMIESVPIVLDDYTFEETSTPPATGIVSGRVRDSHGRWAEGVLIALSLDDSFAVRQTVRTDKEGHFRIEGVRPGSYRLRAGGGDFGRALGQVEVGPDQEVRWFGDLDRGHEITGALTDAAGEPLKGWRVEAVAAGATSGWTDTTLSDDRGRFSLPNVPAGTFDLRLRPDGGKLTVSRIEGVYPGSNHEVSIREAHRLGTVTVRPRNEDGESVPTAEFELWRDAVGEGILLPAMQGEEYTASKLPLETYRTSVRTSTIAPRSLGETQVLSGAPCNLGDVTIASPSLLRIADGVPVPDEGYPVLALYPSVPSQVGTIQKDRRSIALPVGEAVIRTPDGEVRIAVRPGVNEVGELTPGR